MSSFQSPPPPASPSIPTEDDRTAAADSSSTFVPENPYRQYDDNNVAGLRNYFENRTPYTFGEFSGVGTHIRSLQTPFAESCVFKSALNGVIGGGMGVLWGVFVTSMGSGVNSVGVNPLSPNWVDPTTMSTREQFRRTARDMYNSSKHSAKQFAMIGGLYTLVECSIEKTRGTHDLTNALAAGCATGAIIAGKQGPAAIALGCTGFMAFSYVMEQFMGAH